jgi:hypothetical protein
MRLRIGIAVLLVWGAYWAALPWIDCMRSIPGSLDRLFDVLGRPCTFGIPEFGQFAPAGHGLNLLVAAVYLAAAVVMIQRGRST